MVNLKEMGGGGGNRHIENILGGCSPFIYYAFYFFNFLFYIFDRLLFIQQTQKLKIKMLYEYIIL